MHLEDGQIQSVLHGELERTAFVIAQAHLDQCEQCRSAMARARSEETELFTLLERLDQPRRPANIQRVREAARRRRRVPGMRWAAGAVLAVGAAGVAYAVPSSPVRRWIGQLLAPALRVEDPRHATEIPIAPESDLAGVSVAPGATSTIMFSAKQNIGELRISLADIDEIGVRAPTGSAKYATGAGRVLVDNSGAAASYDIAIPRQAPRVQIEVAGVRVWFKDGQRLVSNYAAGADGVVRIPLSR